MGFSLKIQKMPTAEIGARVRKAAEILDLSHPLDRYPKQLSGGQRQRALGSYHARPAASASREGDPDPQELKKIEGGGAPTGCCGTKRRRSAYRFG